MKRKSRKILFLSILAIAVISVIGLSYALLTTKVVGKNKYVLQVGNLNVVLDDSANLNDIIVQNAVPVTDKVGLENQGYSFSLINNESYSMSYSVYIVEDQLENKTPSSAIKVYYSRDHGNVERIRLLSDMGTGEKKLLETGSIAANSTYNYIVKMWLNIDAGNEIIGTSFSCHIEVEATQSLVNAYYDESGANPPELKDNMIPVIWNGSNWVKASEIDEWFNYDEQWWANAVTVSSSTYDKYKNGEVGMAISINDIDTAWVWIPKYEYKINSTDPSEIDVIFVGKDYQTLSTSDYHISPAFSSGDESLSGIWVAKFESSSSNPTADNGGGGDASLDVKIVPGVSSWRNISLSDILTVTQKMSSIDNIYGFNTNDNIHVIKNSEWGAAAYLSHSKYGKYGNSNYSADSKEVAINGSYSFITGNSNHGSEYYSEDGMRASTTGNVYGIYDMSGSCWEFTMSNLNKTVSNSGIDSSWFDNNSNLYDLYTSDSISNACNDFVCYGQSLSETTGWYSDSSYFISSYAPWVIRGGTFYDGDSAGIFAYSNSDGGANSNYGFRLAMY